MEMVSKILMGIGLAAVLAFVVAPIYLRIIIREKRRQEFLANDLGE